MPTEVMLIKAGFVQTNPVRLDRAANFEAVEAMVAASPGADLWVLPELFATGYLFVDRDELVSVAEPLDGPTAKFLTRLAIRHGTSFVAGFAERDADVVFNSAMAVDGDGPRAVYRKTHLFDNEKRWFEPGDSGFVVTTLAGVRVGMMICFDWRFPESARTLALAGAQVIAHPSNLVLGTCQDAMVTRALENGVFTITANRVGFEQVGPVSVRFTGRSRMVAPDGTVLADGSPDAPGFSVVTMDPGLADSKAVTGRNDLFGDRRTGFYRI